MNIEQAQAKAHRLGQRLGRLMGRPLVAVAQHLPQRYQDRISAWAKRKHDETKGADAEVHPAQ
jgi:hypothetical protein